MSGRTLAPRFGTHEQNRNARKNRRYRCHEVPTADVLATLWEMAAIEQETTALVTLTAGAAVKIGNLMAQEPAGEAEVLRIAIQGGGCSGFEYALGFDRGAQAGDHELEFHGVKVVVDPFSAPYLQGSTIVFLEGLPESGLQNQNTISITACWSGTC